jgi:aminopeptidase N
MKRFYDSKIEIYYTKLPQNFIETETKQLSQAMELFTTYLGEQSIPINTVKHVYSPKRFGQGRAGFARPGIIVTSEGRMMDAMKNDATSTLFQDVAHEVAHFWWNFGAGQGDWINEAFAEYFSAVAVEKIASQSQFESVLAQYKKAVGELPADAPSLSKVTFDGPAFVVRYYKGSLMLDDFRRKLGDEAFFAAAREFYQIYKCKSAGTDDFRIFWKAKLGENGSIVDQWVDSEGALPKMAVSAISQGEFGEE